LYREFCKDWTVHGFQHSLYASGQTDRQTDRNTSHARTHARSPGAKKLGDFANLKPRRAHSHPVQTSTGPSWACSLKTTFASDTAFPELVKACGSRRRLAVSNNAESGQPGRRADNSAYVPYSVAIATLLSAHEASTHGLFTQQCALLLVLAFPAAVAYSRGHADNACRRSQG